jgi:hypothetical protein
MRFTNIWKNLIMPDVEYMRAKTPRAVAMNIRINHASAAATLVIGDFFARRIFREDILTKFPTDAVRVKK